MKFGVMALVAAGLSAQTRFDVATVKPGDGAIGSWSRPVGGGYEWHNNTLQQLVMHAYDLMPSQLSGGPDWMRGKQWSVQGKANGVRELTKAQSREPLARLLAERFGLKLHETPKDDVYYELVVVSGGGWKGAKGGLQQGTAENDHWKPKLPQQEGAAPPPAPAPPPWMKSGTQPTGGSSRGTYWTSDSTMEAFVNALRMHRGAYVIDKTGIEGKFHGQLTWDDGGMVPAWPLQSPMAMQAMKKQWGLELVRKKGPVPHWVVDQASLPTAN